MFCFSEVQARLAAVQTAHHDGQTKLTQQIQQLHGEKENITGIMEGIRSQLQHGLFCKLLKKNRVVLLKIVCSRYSIDD